MTARRAARVDDNHAEIVQAFRDCGCSVWSSAQLGRGFPDLVVAVRWNRTLLVEVKDGSKPPSARKLTPDEQQFHDEWIGEVRTVSSVEEALDVVRDG